MNTAQKFVIKALANGTMDIDGQKAYVLINRPTGVRDASEFRLVYQEDLDEFFVGAFFRLSKDFRKMFETKDLEVARRAYDAIEYRDSKETLREKIK